MLVLFNRYKDSGSVYEALLVGKNVFNRNSGDIVVFKTYFEYLCSLAQDTKRDISERQGYLGQSEIVLALFSENVAIDANAVEIIKGSERILSNASTAIAAELDANYRHKLETNIKETDKAIKVLTDLIDTLEDITDQTKFENRLQQIGDVDDLVPKKNLVKRQEAEYNNLTKRCSVAVDVKMREFQHKRDIEYNTRAVDAYEKVYKFFKENDVVNYSQQTWKDFFAYDASRLFNETLVYYNQVYSYVLSKVDDKGRLAITKYAILAERAR
jgi:hypothetical protein